MSTSPDEQELVRRAVTADKAALGELIRLHDAALLRVVNQGLPKDLRRAVDPEDVLAEAYTDLFLGIGRFTPRGPGAFFAWAQTVVQNRLVTVIKRHRALKRGGGRVLVEGDLSPEESSAADLLGQLKPNAHTPSQSAIRRESLVAMEHALTLIPEHYRDALTMLFIEELAPAEVAARLNRSVGAVNMLAVRGLRALAKAMGPASHFFSGTA
jgi:RNA polymerase sigma-70 factor (ECF subfamily)